MIDKDLLEIAKKKKEKERELFISEIKKTVFDVLQNNIGNDINLSDKNDLVYRIKFPEAPDSVFLKNPEDIAKYIEIPEQKDFPKGFEINNFSDITKFIKIPEQKDFPKEFRVSNIKDIVIKEHKVEFPENLKKLSFDKLEKEQKSFFKKFVSFAKDIKNGIFVSNKEPSEAIPVRMVDKDGKEFTGMKHDIIGFPTKIGLINDAGSDINPATDEKIDDVISGLSDVKTAVQSIITTTYSELGDGRKTVSASGIAEQLSVASVPCKEVIVVALITNLNDIAIGDDTVVAGGATKRGIPLMAGQSTSIKIDNLNKIYINADVNGEGITYLYYN
jgi:hypothetical protein